MKIHHLTGIHQTEHRPQRQRLVHTYSHTASLSTSLHLHIHHPPIMTHHHTDRVHRPTQMQVWKHVVGPESHNSLYLVWFIWESLVSLNLKTVIQGNKAGSVNVKLFGELGYICNTYN